MRWRALQIYSNIDETRACRRLMTKPIMFLILLLLSKLSLLSWRQKVRYVCALAYLQLSWIKISTLVHSWRRKGALLLTDFLVCLTCKKDEIQYWCRRISTICDLILHSKFLWIDMCIFGYLYRSYIILAWPNWCAWSCINLRFLSRSSCRGPIVDLTALHRYREALTLVLYTIFSS